MKLQAEMLGKRYRREWILKNLNGQFEADETWAIVGPNGAGKSTLLRMLSGHLSPSAGELHSFYKDKSIDSGALYALVGFAAPYLELIEEFTLREALDFHRQFKPLRPGIEAVDLPDIIQLPRSKNKEVRQFSSGMKQRLKLALALCFDTPLLLLDEPGTNLDREGIAWYQRLLEEQRSGRLVFIASNQEEDLQLCSHRLNIMDYKFGGKQAFSR
jgi:ABC-type multidrug transport system ATPase subunit